MGMTVRSASNEDDWIACARMLLARGAKITDLKQILDHLVYWGSLRLAAFFVENSAGLDTEAAKEVGWGKRTEDAVKNRQAEYAKVLIAGYRRTLGDKEGQALLPDDSSLSTAFGAAVESNQMELVDLLLTASSEEDAAYYAASVGYQLGPHDHLRRYLEERYVIEAVASPAQMSRSRWDRGSRRSRWQYD